MGRQMHCLGITRFLFTNRCQGQGSSHRRPHPSTNPPKIRLDIPELDQLTKKYFSKGLAESTQRSYRSAQNKFLAFCRDGGFKAVPASEETLCRYVSYIANSGLKHRTIKAYLSAIRHLHICEGAGDPFQPARQRL